MVFSQSVAFQLHQPSAPSLPCLVRKEPNFEPGLPLVGLRCDDLTFDRRQSIRFFSSKSPQDDSNNLESLSAELDEEEGEEETFIRRELEHLEALGDVLSDLEDYDLLEVDQDEDDFDEVLWDKDSLNELLGSLQEEDVEEEDEPSDREASQERIQESAAASLERALLQGVVPVSADVGSDCLPGDWGFDPLHLATKDYFRQAQSALLSMLPGKDDDDDEKEMDSSGPRPKALILRDYREAEIRHGRLAMLAAIFWPLQEMLDRLLLDEDQFGPLIYGPVTLPYFPLLMTAIMLLLGYLDIYSQAIKDMDKIGEAFLPGDCFWDPLQMLQGAPDSMKRNMQERELFNGRVAMIAVAAYIWEEAASHMPVISVPGNELLFKPAYQIPAIQQWLDAQFSVHDPESSFATPDNLDELRSILDQVAESNLN